jgi:hypothetical protein
VQNGAMTDCYIIADRGWKTACFVAVFAMRYMDYRAVLHARPRADFDPMYIGANNRAKPDGAIRAYFAPPDRLRRRRHKNPLANSWLPLPKRANHSRQSLNSIKSHFVSRLIAAIAG